MLSVSASFQSSKLDADENAKNILPLDGYSSARFSESCCQYTIANKESIGLKVTHSSFWSYGTNKKVIKIYIKYRFPHGFYGLLPLPSPLFTA